MKGMVGVISRIISRIYEVGNGQKKRGPRTGEIASGAGYKKGGRVERKRVPTAKTTKRRRRKRDSQTHLEMRRERKEALLWGGNTGHKRRRRRRKDAI